MGGRWLNGCRLWGDENVPELDSGDGAQHRKCTRCHGPVHLKMVKMVDFMLLLLFLPQ